MGTTSGNLRNTLLKERAIFTITNLIALMLLLIGAMCVSVNFNVQTASAETYNNVLDIQGDVVSYLESHEDDDYYLGTPYFRGEQNNNNCTHPNGDPRSDGYVGMNCTGFVYHVLTKCKADLSDLKDYLYYYGYDQGVDGSYLGWMNAEGWWAYFKSKGVDCYKFDNAADLLASGKASKGDIIYWNFGGSDDRLEPSADCHIGFFWGDTPSDNKFWHSDHEGNRISTLVSKTPGSNCYLIKSAPATGKITLTKKSSNTSITAGNSNYSLSGAKYGIYSSKSSAQSNSNAVATMTTNASGVATSGDLTAGTYYVKEIKTSSGYDFDTTIYKVTVVAGDTVAINSGKGTPEPPVTIDVPFENSKYDNDFQAQQAQGDAQLAGAEFTVKFYKETNVNQQTKPLKTWVLRVDEQGIINFDEEHFVSGDTFYMNNGKVVLPIGSISWQETKAPEGYLLDDTIQRFSLTSSLDQLQNIITSEQVKRGGFTIQKWDSELNRIEPQGDGNYKGITIEVINKSKNAVVVNGNTIQPDSVAYTASLDENGKFTSSNDLLPYGTYLLREVTDSQDGSYYANNSWTQTIQIREDGEMIDLTASNKGPKDQVLRGGLSIQKFASEVSDGTINQSSNGTFDDINLVSTLLMSKGDRQVASSEVISAASATAVNPQRFIEMVLTAAGENKAIGSESFGMKNNENQTTASDDMATAQAGAMFKGAQITVYNSSKHSVNIIGKGVVGIGGAVTVLTLDENGYASTGNRDLPYGTYTLKETKAPEGYHLNTTWTKTVQIREEGVIVEVGDLPEEQTGFSGVDDQVIRGDYKFVKNAADSQNTLPYTPFLIVNLQSGENHVIVTNENGEFYSSSYVNGNAYNLHTNNTNANDDAITWNEDGTYTIDDTKLDVYAGVWFTGYGPLNDPKNVLAPRVDPNDNLGAYPYGDYAIIELMADANSGYENVVRTFTITREGFEINGGTIEDQWIPVELKTTAKDTVTGTNYGKLDNDVTTIIDTVKFSSGLRANEQYTFTGTLMDKYTNEPIVDSDGNAITSSVDHVVTDDESLNGGVVSVEFKDISSDLLRGKTTVVFEDCYDINGTWIASHANINDEGQTVYYPEIHTTATDNATGQHEGDATSTDMVIINDVVDYNGLQPGKTYTMTGTLMDKKTGEALEGVEPVSTEFTPEESNGSVTMTFEVPAELLRGKTTVVFEHCYLDEAEIAVHADIDDTGQTVSYPEVHTTATDGADGDKTFSGQQIVTLIDTVEYTNLTPSVEYTMTGTLMDKATGVPIDTIEPVSQTFTPDTADGTMEMTFTFDVSDLVGHDIVVFENCYRDFDANGTLVQVAQHADINDEGQTVYVNDAGLADDLIETPLAQTGDVERLPVWAIISATLIMCAGAVIVRRFNANR